MIFFSRLLIAATLCCFALPAISFWQSRDSNYNVSIGGAPAYSGPGDVVSGAKAWWGLRAYNSAAKGTPAVNVCNVSDIACADLSTDAVTGALVISSIGGSSCSIVTCTIKTWYDQSGALACSGGTACNVTQATIGTRSTLVVSCISSLPCAATSNVAGATATNGLTSGISQPFTISAVGNRTGNTSSFQDLLSIDNNDIQTGFSNSTNTSLMFAGSVTSATASDSSFHALQHVYNGASSVLGVDGTESTVNPGTNVPAAGGKFSIPGVSNVLTGQATEVGIWSGGFSSGQRTSMNSNQHSYWGF